MIIGEVIQRVQSLYSKGVESDDSRLSRRHIYNKLLTVRARVTVQELRKNRPYSEWDEQSIDCIEMEIVKYIPCGGGKTCPLMKSKHPLPAAITPNATEGITVKSYDSMITFSRTSSDNYKYLKGNKYTSKKPYYFISDNYLYLLNSRMKKAFVSGIFRDPIKAERLNLQYQNLDTCFNNNGVSFYTPPELIEAIIELSSKELIEIFYSMREDITNNTRDNLAQESK